MDTDPYVLYQPQQNNARNAHQKSQTFYLPSVGFYESPYRFVRRSESEGIPPIYIYITYIYIYYLYIYIYITYIYYLYIYNIAYIYMYIYISLIYIYISMCYCYCNVNGTMIINHGYMFLYPFFWEQAICFRWQTMTVTQRPGRYTPELSIHKIRMSIPFFMVYNIYISSKLFFFWLLPSGNLLHSYGKIHHFLAGKSTISMVIFNSYFDITRGYVPLISHWITIKSH